MTTKSQSFAINYIWQLQYLHKMLHPRVFLNNPINFSVVNSVRNKKVESWWNNFRFRMYVALLSHVSQPGRCKRSKLFCCFLNLLWALKTILRFNMTWNADTTDLSLVSENLKLLFYFLPHFRKVRLDIWFNE